MNAFLTQSHLSLSWHLADIAVQALLDEVRLTPKPALVDQRGAGAHHDLNLQLMESSAYSLFSTFEAMAQAAVVHGQVNQELREQIGRIGRQGEQRMLQITHGINTHRGAIWSLGLMVTAAVLTPKSKKSCMIENICMTAGELARIEDRFVPKQNQTHGQIVQKKFAVQGAKAQAQHNFPVITKFGLPELKRSRSLKVTESQARLNALLAMMAKLSDTCVIYRAGIEGLMKMQQGAQEVLNLGGCSTIAGRFQLEQLEQKLLEIRASAGGAADLLASLLFLDQLTCNSQMSE